MCPTCVSDCLSSIFSIVNIDGGNKLLSRCIHKHLPFEKFHQPFSIKTFFQIVAPTASMPVGARIHFFQVVP